MIRDRLRKQGPRISDDLSLRGFEAFVLENRWLRVTVLPGKGSDIVEFVYKPLDLDVLWRAPAGFWTLERPMPGDQTTGRGFLDVYPGGWQEILPNGGPASGVFPEHGELALQAWTSSVVADDPGHVAVQMGVRTLRAPLHVSKTLSLREGPSLYIDEIVTNLAVEPVEVMWGHHPALGAPFLDGSCVVDLPGTTGCSHPLVRFSTQRVPPDRTFTWPLADGLEGRRVDFGRVQPPGAGTADLIYLTDLRDGWCAVTNRNRDVSFGLAWTVDVFPHLWYWHDANGSTGYPWYRGAYVLALEPWSSHPSLGLAEAVARGTQLTLEPGEQRHARLTVSIGTGMDRVGMVGLDGAFTGLKSM